MPHEETITIRMMFEFGADPAKPWKPKHSQVGKAFKVPEDTGKHKKVHFLKSEFISYVLVECGQYESMYQSYPEFIMHLRAWSRLKLPYWQRTFDLMAMDYNPLENYDRYATIKTFNKEHQKHGDLTTGTTTVEFNEGVTGSQVQADITTEHNTKETVRDTTFHSDENITDTLDASATGTEKRTEDIDVAGYDSGNLVDRQLTTVNDTTTTESTQTEKKADTFESNEHMVQNETEDKLKNYDSNIDSKQDTDSTQNTNTRSNDDGFIDTATKNQISDHTHGNIGVRSSQELFQQEIDVCRWSIYEIMLNDFKDEFCVLVY